MADAPAKVEAAAVKLNTQAVGYGGFILVLISALVPAIAPDIDVWITSLGLPIIVVHAIVAIVGAAAALLGRWTDFEKQGALPYLIGHGFRTTDAIQIVHAAEDAASPSAQPVGEDAPRTPQLSASATTKDAGTAGGRSPKMSATTLQGGIADAVLSLFEANKAKLVALVKAQNVPIETFVENAALALVAKNPMLNLVLQGEIKGSGPALVSALGGEEDAGFAALDALLQSEAKALGG